MSPYQSITASFWKSSACVLAFAWVVHAVLASVGVS